MQADLCCLCEMLMLNALRISSLLESASKDFCSWVLYLFLNIISACFNTVIF